MRRLLLSLVLVVGWSGAAWAQVVFDARSEGEVTTGESLTIAHTSTGSNRVLYAALAHEPGTTDPSGVTATYAGTTMDILFTDVTTHANRRTRVFRLVAPATGANNLVFSWTGNAGMAATVASFTGVDQSDPDDVHGTTDGSAGGTSSSVVVTSAANDMVLSHVVTAPGATALTVGASATEVHQRTGGVPNSLGMSYWAGAATRDMTWSWTGTLSYVSWGWNVNAAGAGAGGAVSLVSGQTLSSLGDHFITDGISAGLSLLATAGTGNLVVVVVYGNDEAGTGDVTSVVDDNGAYTLGRAQQNALVGLFVEIWYRVMTSGIGGGQNIIVTVDVAYSSADNIIAAAEFTGLVTLQESLATNSANTGPSTTHASGTVIPGATDNVVVAIAAGSSRVWTHDTDSWSAVTGTTRMVSSYKIQTSNTAQEYNVTQDVEGYAALAVVAFKGGGGGGGGVGVTPRGLLLGILP